MAYSVGNAVCRLGGVVMVCWIAEVAMHLAGLVEDEAMLGGMFSNGAMD